MIAEVDRISDLGHNRVNMDDGKESGTDAPIVIQPDHVPAAPTYATAEKPAMAIPSGESNLQKKVRQFAGAIGLGFLTGATLASGHPESVPENTAPTPIVMPDTRPDNMPQVEPSIPTQVFEVAPTPTINPALENNPERGKQTVAVVSATQQAEIGIKPVTPPQLTKPVQFGEGSSIARNPN